MIVFHEGLPGAGKSYEACVAHILPALKQGRRVVTNIEGINHDKFAEVSGIPAPYLRGFLVCIFDHDLEKQKQAILDQAGQDTLLVIDEIQNIHPSERQKLPAEWNQFISEHRHHGLDIILMGQDRADCHAMWRRRIQRVVVFTKLSAAGMDNRYRWTVEEKNGSKFQKISSGTKEYDPKYFGLYSSFVDGAEHKEAYNDERAVAFTWKKGAAFVAALLVMAGGAVYALTAFFSPPDDNAGMVAAPPPKTLPIIDSHQVSIRPTYQPRETKQLPAPAELVEVAMPIDPFDADIQRYDPRLGGIIQSEETSRMAFIVEMLDAQNHLKSTWLPREIVDLGWILSIHSYGLEVTKDGVTHVIRSRPLDHFGRVNNRQAEAL